MLNRFMISVAAAALVAGTGLANAQGTMGRDSGGGSNVQHPHIDKDCDWHEAEDLSLSRSNKCEGH